MKQKPQTIIKLVKLNNKSRQGTYILIHQKGQPSRHYKLTGELGQIEATKKHYETTRKQKIHYRTYYKTWKQATKQEKPTKKHEQTYKQIKKYLNKIRKKGTIQQNLQRGTSTTTIKNAENSNSKTIYTKNTELLRKLIIDKDILKIMNQEHNLEKIQSRHQHTIKIQDEEGNILATAERYNTTLKKAIEEIKRSLKNTDKEINKEDNYEKGITGNLKHNGWINIDKKKNGHMYTITLETTIKKG